jgi:phospholipid-binding lipoprotein MlaA
LLEPVAKGYDRVTPDFLQDRVGALFATIRVPRTFLNDLLQGKPLRAAQDFGRLAANLTFGLAGTFDVASQLGIPRNEEDFGQTLARWRVPSGPYTVLPVVGPPFNGANNPRDIFAWPVDIATDPTTWVNAFGIGLVRTVDARARSLEELGQLREDSIDFYVGVRDLYIQQREAEIRDGAPPPAIQDDFYDIEDLDEESGAESDVEQP